MSGVIDTGCANFGTVLGIRLRMRCFSRPLADRYKASDCISFESVTCAR